MMNKNIPQHFSHNYQLQMDPLPTKESDRINLKILLPGLFFGTILFCLGAFELLNGFKKGESSFFDKAMQELNPQNYSSFLSPTFFDIVIMALGLGIIASLIFSYIRYKKIFFDGKIVTIIHRPIFGEKKIFRESIENYDGVQLRIEFYQCGFINKNKYIVELYHKNINKIAPLYISTSDKDIRKIWEGYARKLNLPTLIHTDEGLVKREVADLGKSLREMSKIWDLKKNFNTKPSSCIAYIKAPDKTVIKARKIIWDAFNLLAWLVIFMFGIVCLIVSFNTKAFSAAGLAAFYGICSLAIVSAIFVLFRKDKLVIKKDKIVNTHKYMLFSTKHDEMKIDDIESVDVTVNPVTGRYFVAIASAEKTIIFGKKLPINDLKWVKKFLINEIIKDE